jgi:hypothetical protein
MDKPDDTVHQVTLFFFEQYHDAKVQAGISMIKHQNFALHFGSKSAARYASYDKDSVGNDAPLFSDTSYIEEDLDCGWVPPTSVNKDNNYHSSVPKKDGYLVSLLQ